MPFIDSMDIANRTCQHCGVAQIASPDEDSKRNQEIAFCYDKVRQAELRRNVWRFAIKRVILRAIDSDTLLLAPTAWAAGTTYAVGAVVSDANGQLWTSRIASNLGNIPGEGDQDAWDTYFGPMTVSLYSSETTYFAGEMVYLAGPLIYRSLQSANADTPPSSKWLAIAATASAFFIEYPIGSGPSTECTTRNVYRLPAGFLRQAPSDPKAGGTSYLGAPGGLPYADWLFEGDFIVSAESGPIMLRFIADIQVVSQMDPMFCEGLAARIATEVCETLTQSATKIQTIASAYKLFMGEARTVNAIETGSEEPPLDDYIACRG